MKLFEKFAHKLGLELNESEAVELQLIDEELEQITFNVPAVFADLHREALESQRQQIIEVYRLRREAQSALDVALNSNNNQIEWENAYRKAKKADEVIQLVLMYKVQGMLIGDNHLRFIFTAIVGTLVGIFLKRIFSISPEVFEGWMALYLTVIFAPRLMSGLMASYAQEITSLLVPRAITQEVLDAAQRVDIELSGMMPGERLADSNSLICKLINSVNSAEEFASIGCVDDAPEELCCAILHTLMTDPVGSAQSRHRFERTAILDWLKRRKVHPCTELPLTSDELKRDFKLKLDIARYVSDKFSSKNVNEYRNKSLVNLSIFQTNIQCSDE